MPVPSAGPERGLTAARKKTLAVLDGTRATCLPNGKVLLEISAAAEGISGDAEIIVNGDVVDQVSTDEEGGTISAAAFLPETATGQNLYVAVRIANVMSRVRQVMAVPENVDSPELALKLVRQNPSCLADRNICQLLWKSGKLAEHLRERPADYAAIADQAAKADPDVLAATLEADPFMGAEISPSYLQEHSGALIPLIFKNREAALNVLHKISEPSWGLGGLFKRLKDGSAFSVADARQISKQQERIPVTFLALIVAIFPDTETWGGLAGEKELSPKCMHLAARYLGSEKGGKFIQDAFNRGWANSVAALTEIGGHTDASFSELISGAAKAGDEAFFLETLAAAQQRSWVNSSRKVFETGRVRLKKGMAVQAFKKNDADSDLVLEKFINGKNGFEKSAALVNELIEHGFPRSARAAACPISPEELVAVFPKFQGSFDAWTPEQALALLRAGMLPKDHAGAIEKLSPETVGACLRNGTIAVCEASIMRADFNQLHCHIGTGRCVGFPMAIVARHPRVQEKNYNILENYKHLHENTLSEIIASRETDIPNSIEEWETLAKWYLEHDKVGEALTDLSNPKIGKLFPKDKLFLSVSSVYCDRKSTVLAKFYDKFGSRTGF